MPPEAVLPISYCDRCPRLVVTSLPGRDSWALEELMDTVVARDPSARFEATGYRGVVEVYSSLSPDEIARQFLLYQHAFIARVVPVLACSTPERLGEAMARLVPKGLSAGLELKVRVPLKGRVSEGAVKEALRVAGVALRGREANLKVVVESVGDCLLISVGEWRSCGPHCAVLVPVLP
ncbi:hypothetical protein [Acidilobus saccharovorans]|nr:hypothetical protein [Acidilobus saccharovorans]